MPTADNAIRNAAVMSAIRVSFAPSTRITGATVLAWSSRRSTSVARPLASHRESHKETATLITVSGETRTCPTFTDQLSSSVVSGSSRPKMLSAAIDQALKAMKRASPSLATSIVTRRISSQAVSRLATIVNAPLGHLA